VPRRSRRLPPSGPSACDCQSTVSCKS
jgi:hypothetical protein